MINTSRLTKITGLPAGFRLESGPTQFGEDQPGVFLRGEAAIGIGFMIASYVADGLNAGRTSVQDFARYGFLIKHAQALVACDLTGVVAAQVQAVIDRLHAVAHLADVPAAGGVQ